MMKPTSMCVEELINKLSSVIEESQLPMCVSDLVVQQFASQFHTIAVQASAVEKKEYEEFLKQRSVAKTSNPLVAESSGDVNG